MVKRVAFNPRVKVWSGSDKDSIHSVSLQKESDLTTPMIVAGVIGLCVTIAVLATWIAGLVRMGGCNGGNAAYFWITLLVFLLIPGPGTVAGFAMSIVALIMLKPGSTTLGMSCPTK